MAARPVGTPEAWPGTIAFLDGTQRIEVVGYFGSSPLVAAEAGQADPRPRKVGTEDLE